eukprot:jgi/Bigna1/140092/aug1.54_g14800
MSAAVSGLFIRPPRSKYDRKSLGPRLQKLASWRGYPIIVRREDFQIRNRRNLNLECSLYVPVGRSDGKSHCILYCHGASGGKLDGITDVWEIGEYITLGMWEEDDVRCIVKELVEKLGYKSVMLWGRSMGSVACIRAASRDPFEWIPPPPAPSDEEYRKWRIDELVNLILELEEDWEDGKSGIQSPKPSPTESYEKMFESDSSSEAKVKRVGTGTCAARSMDLGSMEKAELITRVQELTTKIRDREAINKKVGFMRVVSCVVADSPFGNLWNASRHIIEHYKSVVPQFMLRGLASVGLPIVRKSILKQIPEFDIKKLDCVSGAAHCRVPAIIMHAVNDTLIPWEESRQVYEAWGTKVYASSGARSRLSSKEISNQKTLQSRNPSNPPNTPRSKSPQARVAAAAGASGGREEPGLETPSQNRRLETAVPSEDMKEEKTKKDEDRGSGREEEKGEEAKTGHKPPLNLTKEMLDKRRKDSLGILNSHNGQGGQGSDLDAPFRTTNRRAESPANLPSPLRSPKERGITLYAITFAELLSFHMASPAQLRFMFLDESKTQRRVRFYSPEVPTLKDHIDRAIRKLVSHDHMTTIELMAKITKNLAGASAALVEKRLLSARGLTIAEVGDIIESLNSAIESMLGERPEGELPEGVEPEDMVIKAVLHAVEVRTGWRPDISKLAKSKKKQKNRKGNRCAIS